MYRAWIFAAGLVLGFTLFANVESDSDTENTFARTRDVLKKLSYQSPQAKHYYDVLRSFFEAINKRRKQLARERRNCTSQYLDQILVLDIQQDQRTQYTITDSADDVSLPMATIENRWNSPEPLPPGILDNFPDILVADWGAFAVQISEQLTYSHDGGRGTSPAL
jgi:hypothetical protein